MKRILIILMGSLGDVVRGLSVADGIKSANPEVFVSWLVEPKCKAVVELSPSVDEILLFDRQRPVTGFFTLIPEIRGFDVVLDLQRHFKSGLFSLLSAAPRRIGFHRKNSKEGNWIFNTETIPAYDDSLNKFLHYQKFLEQLQMPTRLQTTLKVGEMPKRVQSVEKKIATLVMSTSWNSKNWVQEGYELLIRRLLDQDYAVVLVGDQKQESLGFLLQEKYENVISLVGKTSLSELVTLLKNSSVSVGPDSGPGHIAAALGTPYISLFGPTSAERVAPFGFEDLVVKGSIGCSPCYRRECPGLDKLCMRLISVDAIMHKIEYGQGKEKRTF